MQRPEIVAGGEARVCRPGRRQGTIRVDELEGAERPIQILDARE